MIAHKIPSVCCDDGPSGMRLDSGMKAFSLPNGTLCGCSFNKELNTRLYALLGLEMTANKVEVLLGPGMNIHRHPLNGRNFEYFSEDPYLTGSIATAQLEGLKSSGVSERSSISAEIIRSITAIQRTQSSPREHSGRYT